MSFDSHAKFSARETSLDFFVKYLLDDAEQDTILAGTMVLIEEKNSLLIFFECQQTDYEKVNTIVIF